MNGSKASDSETIKAPGTPDGLYPAICRYFSYLSITFSQCPWNSEVLMAAGVHPISLS